MSGTTFPTPDEADNTSKRQLDIEVQVELINMSITAALEKEYLRGEPLSVALDATPTNDVKKAILNQKSLTNHWHVEFQEAEYPTTPAGPWAFVVLEAKDEYEKRQHQIELEERQTAG